MIALIPLSYCLHSYKTNEEYLQKQFLRYVLEGDLLLDFDDKVVYFSSI